VTPDATVNILSHDEVFVRVNGETRYLWRTVDHEGEVLEVFATKLRDRGATLNFLKRAMKRYGRPNVIVTDRLRSYLSAMDSNRFRVTMSVVVSDADCTLTPCRREPSGWHAKPARA
jgi:transposase-like protein